MLLSHPPRHIASILIIVCIAAGFIDTPATAQSEQELRQVIQRLRIQISNLQNELRSVQSENERLKSENEQLKNQLTELLRTPPPSHTSPTTTKPATGNGQVTVDESAADANPLALFSAIQNDYAETMKDMERGQEGDRQRIKFMRKLDQWQAGINRRYQSQINWYVHIVEIAQSTDRGVTVSMIAVDPITGDQLGDQFPALLVGNALLRRLAELETKGELDILLLRGVLIPEVEINPDRETAGTFDSPKFIGPYAEFGFTVEVQSLIPAPEPDEETDKVDESNNERADR